MFAFVVGNKKNPLDDKWAKRDSPLFILFYFSSSYFLSFILSNSFVLVVPSVVWKFFIPSEISFTGVRFVGGMKEEEPNEGNQEILTQGEAFDSCYY